MRDAPTVSVTSPASDQISTRVRGLRSCARIAESIPYTAKEADRHTYHPTDRNGNERPAPGGPSVHVPTHHSVQRISTASAIHIGTATSLSPKLYWVRPPTRNPKMEIHAPAATAQTSAAGAPLMATHPLRSAVA